MSDERKAAANKKAREERKKALLEAMRGRYVDAFRAYEASHPSTLAHHVHATIDDVLARDRAKDRTSDVIRCTKGCSHCCKVPVEVFPHEAALLVDSARETGLKLDVDRLRRQSRYGIGDWGAQPVADRACVFLDANGGCSVYASRPDACRKLLVVTEPMLCDAERHEPERAGRWISWEAEILAAAALEAFGARLMPIALLAVLHDEHDRQSVDRQL